MPHCSHVEFTPPAYCNTALAVVIRVEFAATVKLDIIGNHLDIPLLGGESKVSADVES